MSFTAEVIDELARVHHRADKADVRFALQYGAVNARAVAAAEQEAEVRVFLVEVGDELRENVLHRDG